MADTDENYETLTPMGFIGYVEYKGFFGGDSGRACVLVKNPKKVQTLFPVLRGNISQSEYF